MITARSSLRGSVAAALATALLIVLWQPVSAHRRDEYLQAARIGVEPTRLELQLDLTPGIAMAPTLLAEIDRDGNGTFETGEASAYVDRVQREIRVEFDRRPLAMRLVDHRFPQVAAVIRGEGTIQLRFEADIPQASGTTHRVFYRNNHHPADAAYLANALAPATAGLSLLAQRRDIDQRELTIEYTFGRAAGTAARVPLSWWLALGLAGAVAMVADSLTRRRRRDGASEIP